MVLFRDINPKDRLVFQSKYSGIIYIKINKPPYALDLREMVLKVVADDKQMKIIGCLNDLEIYRDYHIDQIHRLSDEKKFTRLVYFSPTFLDKESVFIKIYANENNILDLNSLGALKISPSLVFRVAGTLNDLLLDM